MLQIAACLGNEFKLQTLAIAHGQVLMETAADLWSAIARHRFILPLDETYKLISSYSLTGNPLDFFNIQYKFAYKFAHDRIQQAAYTLIPENQLNQIHLLIGQRLLRLLEANNVSSLFCFYFGKLMLHYLFKDYARAVENAKTAESYIAGVGSLMMVPQHNFYSSLAKLAYYSQAENPEPADFLARVKQNQETLATWCNYAPENYQHKFDLVAAELERVAGDALPEQGTGVDRYFAH